eukprot:TRINITY_DN71042_c0_g1_i1.p1 TRINITY_DN71042_c0_g1~~TRINITY_DN71042_c0_g1_i1.p1  ORF type:complete len:324 (-),score=55.78 TRINITY_DN71042_c0_g1_i1:25-996(-)
MSTLPSAAELNEKLLSKKDLHSSGKLGGDVHTWMPPADVLPSIPEIVEKLNALAAENPELFTIREGVDRRTQNMFVEKDLSIVRKVFMTLLKGETRCARMRRFFYFWHHKDTLIKTIEALSTLEARASAVGDRLDQLMFGETKSYFRNSIHSAAIASSVSMKIAQVTYLVGYMSLEFNSKALHEPPPPNLRRVPCVIDEASREKLRTRLDPGKVPSVRPADPGWFQHDIPLMESPLWTVIKYHLEENVKQQEDVFCERMSFLRSFLCDVRSYLKSQQDQVTFAQAKMYGLIGSAIISAASHYSVVQSVGGAFVKAVYNSTSHS